MFEKVVIITRKTRLSGLIERFNSREQARFYIEQSGGDFSDYLAEDQQYRLSLEILKSGLKVMAGLKTHFVDRDFVPNYLFTEKDMIVAIGQDGLVANIAKYVGNQPIVGVNPDPSRFDGVLLPFLASDVDAALRGILQGKARLRKVNLAEAVLSDGQRLLAFNDLFIGVKSHVSARYMLQHGGRKEFQSSSGLIVSTGAGSTGWLSSVFGMYRGLSQVFENRDSDFDLQLKWEDPSLVFVVREPYASRHSGASIVAGMIKSGEPLILESRMPSDGVVFSDGVEADFVNFNSGVKVEIHSAKQKANLVVK